MRLVIDVPFSLSANPQPQNVIDTPNCKQQQKRKNKRVDDYNHSHPTVYLLAKLILGSL